MHPSSTNPQLWNLGGDEGTPAGCAANAASSDLDFFAEFFGPLSPAAGAAVAQLLSHPAVLSGDSAGAEFSGRAEEGSSSHTKGGLGAAAAAAGGGPRNQEGDGKSEQPLRKRKRSRTSEMHNLTERRRRDRINEKLKTLQELIPNAHKLDKACLLDETIAYVKSLQQHLQILSGGNRLCAGPPAQPLHPQLPTALPHGLSLHPAAAGVLNLGMGLMPAAPHGVPPCTACSPATAMISPAAPLLTPPPPPPPLHLQPSPVAAAMRYYYHHHDPCVSYQPPDHQHPSSADVSSQALQEHLHTVDRAGSSSSMQE